MKDLRIRTQYTHWTRQRVINEIKDIVRGGNAINPGLVMRYYKHIYKAAYRYFGNWEAAVKASGFDYDRTTLHTYWTRKKAIDRLKDHIRTGVKLNYTNIESIDKPLYRAAVKFWGTWDDFLKDCGTDPKSVRLHQKWSKGLIVRTIINMKNSQCSLNTPDVIRSNRKLFRAACGHFGSWEAAVYASMVPGDAFKATIIGGKKDMVTLINSKRASEPLIYKHFPVDRRFRELLNSPHDQERMRGVKSLVVSNEPAANITRHVELRFTDKSIDCQYDSMRDAMNANISDPIAAAHILKGGKIPVLAAMQYYNLKNEITRYAKRMFRAYPSLYKDVVRITDTSLDTGQLFTMPAKLLGVNGYDPNNALLKTFDLMMCFKSVIADAFHMEFPIIPVKELLANDIKLLSGFARDPRDPVSALAASTVLKTLGTEKICDPIEIGKFMEAQRYIQGGIHNYLNFSCRTASTYFLFEDPYTYSPLLEDIIADLQVFHLLSETTSKYKDPSVNPLLILSLGAFHKEIASMTHYLENSVEKIINGKNTYDSYDVIRIFLLAKIKNDHDFIVNDIKQSLLSTDPAIADRAVLLITSFHPPYDTNIITKLIDPIMNYVLTSSDLETTEILVRYLNDFATCYSYIDKESKRFKLYASEENRHKIRKFFLRIMPKVLPAYEKKKPQRLQGIKWMFLEGFGYNWSDYCYLGKTIGIVRSLIKDKAFKNDFISSAARQRRYCVNMIDDGDNCYHYDGD